MEVRTGIFPCIYKQVHAYMNVKVYLMHISFFNVLVKDPASQFLK